MVGEDSEKPLQITYERESGLDVSRPKHGKVWLISVCLHQAYRATKLGMGGVRSKPEVNFCMQPRF